MKLIFMGDKKDEFKPFDSIGLCFSGGGYRATFFSLGVVSYLNKIQFDGNPLLEKVEAISSVSGGTLLAVAYAKAVQDSNFNFDTFYKAFYSSFTSDTDKLLENAVSKLGDDSIWKNTRKKRSLINAFALTYADFDIFKGDFELFKDMKPSSNLKNVCFNATEFSYGLGLAPNGFNLIRLYRVYKRTCIPTLKIFLESKRKK